VASGVIAKAAVGGFDEHGEWPTPSFDLGFLHVALNVA
jgi:hypothetical protein